MRSATSLLPVKLKLTSALYIDTMIFVYVEEAKWIGRFRDGEKLNNILNQLHAGLVCNGGRLCYRTTGLFVEGDPDQELAPGEYEFIDFDYYGPLALGPKSYKATTVKRAEPAPRFLWTWLLAIGRKSPQKDNPFNQPEYDVNDIKSMNRHLIGGDDVTDLINEA